MLAQATPLPDERERPMPIEKIILQGLHPHPGPEENDEKTHVTLESINITSMVTNQEAVMSRKADITVFQEHKLTEKAKLKAENDFKDNGYKLECGPCCTAGTKPSAGVGIVVANARLTACVLVWPRRPHESSTT